MDGAGKVAWFARRLVDVIPVLVADSITIIAEGAWFEHRQSDCKKLRTQRGSGRRPTALLLDDTTTISGASAVGEYSGRIDITPTTTSDIFSRDISMLFG